MNAKELIGKEAIRTAPIYEKKATSNGLYGFGDAIVDVPNYRFCNIPVLIVNVTDSHIVYRGMDVLDGTYSSNGYVLDCRYCDDNWTDYHDLINAQG